MSGYARDFKTTKVIAAAETWLDRQLSDFFEWFSKVTATG
jgi:hypothetical protein